GIRAPIIFGGTDFGAILARFQNLSFEDILAGLRVLIDYLRSLNGSDGGSALAGVLNTKIPLIDRSLSEMLDVADALDLGYLNARRLANGAHAIKVAP
ncbi:MAG: hypothetical protein KY393_09465, partial [Actinobacteria bacterium]|nr:hypothetical protein [Actinomycetota bacterium]